MLPDIATVVELSAALVCVVISSATVVSVTVVSVVFVVLNSLSTDVKGFEPQPASPVTRNETSNKPTKTLFIIYSPLFFFV
ncbi:hypothetical protein SDC9_199408 [bioreactor metagenome]|uniref:Uncharacterized protein n=1 Tax=bioreactor metagenome TaxID=1076179 RepID=A0A645IMQ2_9ZZZZ